MGKKEARMDKSDCSLVRIEEVLTDVLSYLGLFSFLGFGATSKRYLGLCKRYLVSEYGVSLRWDLLDIIKSTVRRDMMTNVSVWTSIHPGRIAPATVLKNLLESNPAEQDESLEKARMGMQYTNNLIKRTAFPTVDFFLIDEYEVINKSIKQANTNFYWYFKKLLYTHCPAFGELMSMWYIRCASSLDSVASVLFGAWCPSCCCDLNIDLKHPIYLVCSDLCGCKLVYKKGENSMRNYINHTPVPHCRDCFYSHKPAAENNSN